MFMPGNKLFIGMRWSILLHSCHPEGMVCLCMIYMYTVTRVHTDSTTRAHAHTRINKHILSRNMYTHAASQFLFCCMI